MTLNSALHSVTVEGYRFCRSDGKPFDLSVMTFVPPTPATNKMNTPYAVIFTPTAYDSQEGEKTENLYHVCDRTADMKTPTTGPFILAHRCDLSWNTLSDQQKDIIRKIEHEVETYRKEGVFFRSVIMEGLGGCGKTRLMAYVINHSPENTHVMYLTKQNKRIQDFLYDELTKGELVPPRPIVDMSKCTSSDFRSLPDFPGGRYACSVEKLVYNVVGHLEARQTNTRCALQWKMNIPDTLYADEKVKSSTSNVVVFLDEYTMISPPLLHKMLHCIEILFSAPTVLIMGGDRFQLGPIDWNERTDKSYRDKCGEEAARGAVTRNNRYYMSDVREELKMRLKQEPYEYQMVGSQRCRDDRQLAEMVVYLRNACQKRSAIKAIERRLVAFGRSRGIHLFRYDALRQGCKTGRLVFKTGDGRDLSETEEETAIDDQDDEDRHLSDNDLRDTSTVEVDWNSPPAMDMTPFIDFYAKLYEDIYTGYTEGCLHDLILPTFVYEKASKFASNSYPCFMVKKNDKCNLLSDTFLKTLYNGVYTTLDEKYAERQAECSVSPERSEGQAKRSRLSTLPNGLNVKTFLEKLCVSIPVSEHSPVQQTMMVGVPYRMTDTLKSVSTPVVSNGELVLLTAIEFDADLSIRGVIVKTLQRPADHFLIVKPGLTQNRLNNASGKQQNHNHGPASRNVYMLPMVPMVCENIYQMQGNTVLSDCFVDLLSTKRDDIYVAVSRFQKSSSIKGIVLSR